MSKNETKLIFAINLPNMSIFGSKFDMSSCCILVRDLIDTQSARG